MQVLGLAWGILSVIGMTVAFLPCLGALNWLNIPFAIAGLAVSIIGANNAAPDKRHTATAGIVLNSIAIGLGAMRLLMGNGIL
jgi:hypothetical protein